MFNSWWSGELWKSFWRKHSKEDFKFSKKKIFVSVSEPLWRQIFDRILVIKPKIKETNSIKPNRVTPDKNSPYNLKFNINSLSTVHYRATVHFLDQNELSIKTHRMLFPMLRKNRHFRLKWISSRFLTVKICRRESLFFKSVI